MQSDPTSPSPFETRCENCDVSFPSETRQCLHCGAPLGARFPWSQVEEAPQPSGDEGSLVRRLGSAAIWIVLALSAVFARLCEG